MSTPSPREARTHLAPSRSPLGFSLLSGAAAGAVATVPMTIVMLTLYRLLPRDEQEPVPPREITENLVHGLDLDVSGAEPVLTAMTIVGHFSYGAFCGLLYAAATRRTRERYLSLGMLFGLVVWIVSYVAWLPAVGIFRTATQQAPRRNAAMVLAHVIWGLALGVTFRRLDAAKAST